MFGIRRMLRGNGPAKNLFVLLTCFIFVFTAITPVTAAESGTPGQNYSISDVQKKLSEKGYDAGKIDGVMGQKTRQALKNFQKDNGVKVTGDLDLGTANKLFGISAKTSSPETSGAAAAGSAVTSSTATASSAASKAQTAMKHSPPDYFVTEHRIQLDASVNDPAGVNVARCYFKAAGEADFVFVPMTKTGGDKYSAILPAPSKATQKIEYLFLAVNSGNNIVKSQSFTINREEKDKVPAWQNIAGKEEIQVSMELDTVPSSLNGFTDNIVMNQVESGLRFGVVAGGIYYLTKDKASHTSGAASSATSSGTVAAGAAGLSTLAWAGIIGGGVVLAGGTAAAVGGGGGGGGGGSSHGETLTEQTIVGNWNVGGSATWGATTSGTIIYNNNGTFSYSLTTTQPGESPGTDSGTGTWTLVGTDLTLSFDAGAVYNGQASGTSTAFTMVSSNGWTLNFTR